MANDSPSSRLAVNLRKYRADKEMTQTAVARSSGVSNTYLSELESGAGRRPSGDVLLRLADALGVTIADLLDRSITPAAVNALPDGLAEFAALQGLPEADVQMLASIRFRGEPPRTPRRWQHIYDAIRMSRPLDGKP